MELTRRTCIQGRCATSTPSHKQPAEAMENLNEIRLRFHHRVDRFVGAGRLVNYIGVLTAFNPFRHADVIVYRKLLLCLVAGNHASCPVAAAVEALRVSFSTYDGWKSGIVPKNSKVDSAG